MPRGPPYSNNTVLRNDHDPVSTGQSECQSRTHLTTRTDQACLPAGIPRIAPRIPPGETFALARRLSRGWKAAATTVMQAETRLPRGALIY